MKLYYTVASAYDAPQPVPVNSIGGYKSSTPLSNGFLDSVFDEISLRMMGNPQSQYKAIVLVNELPVPATNIELWFSTPENQITYCDFTIAAVAMSLDKEGHPIMERSQNIFSKPFYADFHKATVEEKVGLGTMEPGSSLGLWLCRTPIKEVIVEDYNNVAEIDPLSTTFYPRYKRVEKEKEESVDMNITWT